jgi:acetyl-CoA acetyltransferase
MSGDDVWVLGIHMTKFGKHPDKDVVDLASESVLGALADAGVSMADIDVIGAGNLMGASSGIGQQVQKQVGQTGIPVYNVVNACATGATAFRVAYLEIKAGESDIGLAFGVEKLAGAGLLGGGQGSADGGTWAPRGRFGAVTGLEGHTGTSNMPGVFAQIGLDYAHRYGGADFELFARISEKNHSHSTLNPLAAHRKPMSAEQIMADVMVAYPNTRPMCSANVDGAAAAVLVSGERLKSLSPGQRRRAVKVTTSTWSNCTTASRPPNSCTTTTSCCARKGERSTSSTPARPGVTARRRSTSPEAWSPRGTRSPLPGSPTSGRSPPTCAARRARGRSTGPGSG